MADPKYAGLPGIVYDQPDTYETSDLPESEQDFEGIDRDDTSGAIEVLHISGTEAYNKFKGKLLDSSLVDFSDKISRRTQNGYAAKRVEWEIGGEDETIVQKYQRLKCEIDGLQQEVQNVKGDIDHCGGKVSITEINEQVQGLHSSFVNMNLEQSLGSKELLDLFSTPDAALQQSLSTLLGNMKNSDVKSVEKKTADKSRNKDENIKGANVTYELAYTPEHAKLNQLARASQLEKRLDKLELLIGNNPEKLSSLSAWTNHKSLMDASQVLSSRLSLLEPAHLDHVEGRLHAVHTKMNSFQDKKNALEDADKQNKITELYELMKRCDKLSSDFPEVVSRLVSIENVHQEATNFAQRLKQLNDTQSGLSESLQSNSSQMVTVQKAFTDNLSSIQKTIAALEERVSKLPKK